MKFEPVVVSLFNGMNGIGLAFSEIGITPKIYASEVDKFANQLSSHLFPNTVNLGDVRNVKIKDIGHVDLVVAGSPCQGFSRAGDQLNFDHPESKLFFEFLRVLKEAREINPNVKFLLENVVPTKKEWSHIISKFMGIEPIKINSSRVSAQSRERLYWTNIYTNKDNLFGYEQPGIKQPFDQRAYLSSIIEPYKYVDQKYFWTKEKFDHYLSSKRLWFKMHPITGEQVLCVPEATKKGYCEILDGECFDWKHRNSKNRRGRKMQHKSHTIVKENDFYIFQNGKVRKLIPKELCKLQTVPNWAIDKILNSGVSDTQINQMLGNGWTIKVIAHIISHIDFNSWLKEERSRKQSQQATSKKNIISSQKQASKRTF